MSNADNAAPAWIPADAVPVSRLLNTIANRPGLNALAYRLGTYHQDPFSAC